MNSDRGGYRMSDSRPYGGPDRGAMTETERKEINKRRTEAATPAAAAALATMQAKIAAIQGNGALSADRKRWELRMLHPSGLSVEEARVLRDAQGY